MIDVAPEHQIILKGVILMDTIIYEVVEKIIYDYEEIVKDLIENVVKGHGDISESIRNLAKSLDEAGVELVKGMLETVDDIVRKSKNRNKMGYNIERRNEKKTLITIFSDVNYTRTYYRNKKDGSYAYLSDEALGIEPYNRMDLSFKAKLVENSLDLSYRKSGERASESTKVTDQTVMNTIRELSRVDNNLVEIKEEKKDIDIIFIEADEDHVAMQDGTNKQIKLVYVHEGRKLVSKGRYKLKNLRYFTGEFSSLNFQNDTSMSFTNSYTEQCVAYGGSDITAALTPPRSDIGNAGTHQHFFGFHYIHKADRDANDKFGRKLPGFFQFAYPQEGGRSITNGKNQWCSHFNSFIYGSLCASSSILSRRFRNILILHEAMHIAA